MSALTTITNILVKELNRKRGEIMPEADLNEDLGADDLDRVQIVLEIERVFGITLDDEAMFGVRTVADLCALVERAPADEEAS